MTDTQLCDCHGTPMYWGKDRRYKRGGFWRCSVKHRRRVSVINRNRYRDDPEFRAAIEERKWLRRGIW